MALLVSGQVLLAQSKEVNKEMSSIEWHGKKIGGKHEGFIQLKSGSLELKGDQIVAGDFVVDMSTISNTDLKSEGSNQKLVGHLKSDDFFGVEKFPTATFKVVESSKFSNGTATLTGDITIKGKTERISFDVTRDGKAYMAEMEIDRSKFDVRYGSKSFFNNLGNNAIDDMFKLRIKLVLA